nr:amino acid--tRNA ligase-related protein [Amycolatopsis umgeniensis]
MGRGSDSSPVRIRLEGVDTYLADSMQFLLEFSCRLSDGPVYYVMPSFRGEAADDTHLCQFFHSEAELVGGLDEVTATVDDYVRHLATAFLEQAPDLVAHLAGTAEHLREPFAAKAFNRIPFDEAVSLLGADPAFVKTDVPGARSLTRAGERRLMDLRGPFTWVTHMDHLSTPFYQAFAGPDKDKAQNGDLLFGIGETVGCGERHATVDEVTEALALHEVDRSDYEWYVKMREISPLRTAGFGMGVERFMLWLLAHDDIRDLPLLLRFNGQQIDP